MRDRVKREKSNGKKHSLTHERATAYSLTHTNGPRARRAITQTMLQWNVIVSDLKMTIVYVFESIIALPMAEASNGKQHTLYDYTSRARRFSQQQQQ